MCYTSPMNEIPNATPNVIVVDDEREFDFPATYFRTLEAAMLHFDHDPTYRACIDELWLDHDLGGSDEDPIDIRPLIDLLQERAYLGTPWWIVTVVVCTDNEDGRAYIHAALDRYYNVIDIPPAVKWRVIE